MAHIIQLALGAFTIALGVKAPTNSWETLEQDQQVGENGSTHIAKRQRLWKECNAKISKVSST
jgi:hypothetical protein